MKKNNVLWGLALGVVLFAAGALFTLTVTRDKEVSKPDPVADFQGTLSDIGQLATAEYGYTLTKVSDKEAFKLWGVDIPFTSGKIIYSYNGVIKAGFSFRDIETEVDEAAKTVRISLPRAQIISSEVDFDSFRVYDEKNSVFNPFTAEDFNENLADFKAEGERQAIEGGVLERAAENAEKLLTAYAQKSFGDDYTIEFASLV